MTWHVDPADDGPRGGATLGAGGGSYPSTDPYLALPAERPSCAPVGLSNDVTRAAYEARTAGRRAVLTAVEDQCLWHLMTVEIKNQAVREIVIASRELSLKLQQSQIADDQLMVRKENEI